MTADDDASVSSVSSSTTVPFPEPGPLLSGAGFGIRAFARVVDMAVVFLAVAGGTVAGMIPAAMGRHPEEFGPYVSQRMDETAVLGYATSFLAGLLYHSLAEWLTGQTFGKAACGLRVLRKDGSRCGLGSAVVRSAAFIVDGLFFGFVALSAMREGPLQQRVGDKWANTVVITREEAGLRPPMSHLRTAAGLGAAFLGVVAVEAMTLALRLR